METAVSVIFSSLESAGLKWDEGPGVGGAYGPYTQSERMGEYVRWAEALVEKGMAYYCFCDKDRLKTSREQNAQSGYDGRCRSIDRNEAAERVKRGEPHVVRQLIPEGVSVFHDAVYGDITIDNAELEDQTLLKSDGMPTYNFANVIDDHLMNITHVVRGAEYLSSTPKYNLLYDAFGWRKPIYIHLPHILDEAGEKLSKRDGSASFQDLLDMGFLPEAVLNYIALLGWSPRENKEFFTLDELVEAFDINGLSKAPAIFDAVKLKWMNGEYIKKMPPEVFYALARPYLENTVTREGVDLKTLAEMMRTRVEFVKDCAEPLDFIDRLPDYSAELYRHKKMKTDEKNSLISLESVVAELEAIDDWSENAVHEALITLAEKLGVKNGRILWPARVALSGKQSTPCGATEILALLGKEESLRRLKIGVDKLRVCP
jgi:glutamyl-tRNA synthetase